MIWATIMTVTPGLNVINTIAASSVAEPARKTFSEPNFWPNLAPSMANPATATECATITVPTVVGAVWNSVTIPPIETGSALMFSDICAWPMAMTTMGSHALAGAAITAFRTGR
jgi:hypothetical protein